MSKKKIACSFKSVAEIKQAHEKIAEKIQERSPEAAMEAMTEHLSDMQFILSRLPAAKTLKWFKK